MLNVLFQFPLMLRRQDRIIFAKIVGIERVRCGDHLFMDLLSRPEADHFLYAIGANGCGYIGYFVRWDFGDEDLTTPRSEEHTSELQSRGHLVCRLLHEKKK